MPNLSQLMKDIVVGFDYSGLSSQIVNPIKRNEVIGDDQYQNDQAIKDYLRISGSM